MKIFMIPFLLIVLLCAQGLAEEYRTETGKQVETDMGIEPQKAPYEGKSPLYKSAMRSLDREYRAGGLTKVEYLQRKREIGNLYD